MEVELEESVKPQHHNIASFKLFQGKEGSHQFQVILYALGVFKGPNWVWFWDVSIYDFLLLLLSLH